jgi:hypothetical protein
MHRVLSFLVVVVIIGGCSSSSSSSKSSSAPDNLQKSDTKAGTPPICADPAKRPIGHITPNQDGSMHLLFTNAAPTVKYDIQATDSLTTIQWTTLATGTADSQGEFTYDDYGAIGQDMRYYRALGHGPDPGCSCPLPGGSENGGTCPLGTTFQTTQNGDLECCPCTANDCKDLNCCATNACQGKAQCVGLVCNPLPADCNGRTDTDCDDWPEDCDMHCCACYDPVCL